MPKLVVFAPCDNVLINKDGESASLITILTHIRFPYAPPPELDMVPVRWFVFSQWVMLDEDFGITFQQKLELRGAEGSLLTTEREFTSEPGKIHYRVVAGVPGFPVLPEGIFILTISLRKKDQDDWVPHGEYPIAVSYGNGDGEAPASK